jgi:membrane protease YdiL (CAAX protease family)
MSTAAKPAFPLVSQRMLSLAEIAVAYALIEGALWSATPQHRYIWAWLATVWIVGITLIRRPRLQSLGLTRHGLRESLWVIGAGLVFSAAVITAAFFAGTLHDYSANGDLALRATGYLIWAFEQEFILQSFIFSRLESVFHRGTSAVLVAALLFSAAHIPSPVLVVGSFFMAYLFCSVFRRYRNLYPLTCTHWMVGLAISLSLPDWVGHHMHVGIGYFQHVGR